MFTAGDEDGPLFALSGTYPTGGNPGLRTVLASATYLLAMKLHALQSLDRGDRDLHERAPSAHLGLSDVKALERLYRAIYGEDPPEVRARFPAGIAVTP
jgi:hypothetical protein